MGCIFSSAANVDPVVAENTRMNESALSPREFLEERKKANFADDNQDAVESPRKVQARALHALWEDKKVSPKPSAKRLRSNEGDGQANPHAASGDTGAGDRACRTSTDQRTRGVPVSRMFSGRMFSGQGDGSSSPHTERAKKSKQRRAMLAFASKDYVAEFDADSTEPPAQPTFVEKTNEVGRQKRKSETTQVSVGSGELV
ncbi:hypothetical protein FVE85_0507 [Porphyridium purpureum]|uniref:Uncharacterized protein n=1 Tax=Porphyridium purpureum TaxID=35688 RepID=A0A5J4Z0A4_PORPP|nr:hypothetical protein FVE85_0507 [Porphyridium purpureum]|eukprot:POR1280..scf208_2